MQLSLVRLSGIGPLQDVAIPLVDDEGTPRKLAVLFGAHGVGKTSILAAIASTRPGHAVAQIGATARGGALPAFVVAHWTLGDDDPARPHPLCVASPNATLDEREDAATLRRREQTLFDRRAGEGGFVLVSFSGARWFSRTPVMITTPERTIMRYDVRASTNFDDATRADLTRETKQALSFAAAAAALSSVKRARDASSALCPDDDEEPMDRFTRLDQSLRRALNVLLECTGCSYIGVDPARLEPIFEGPDRRAVELDDLPKSARHLAAFGALTARALAAAYPDRAAEEAEGVALIDDAESSLDPALQRALPGLLRQALPRVQWILSTSSPALTLGCDVAEVVALRRETSSGRVEVYQGPSAVVH